MLRDDEIEKISHNVAKIFVDIQTQQMLRKGEMPMPSDVTKEYLAVYLKSKQTTVEYLERKKLEVEKMNPFNDDYSSIQEHPKLR